MGKEGRAMKKLNFFDYWTIGELIYSLVLLLILPRQIQINFWFILTSQEPSGSSFNIFALPVIMALPNLLQRILENKWIYFENLHRLFLLANLILLCLTSFWLFSLPFIQ